MALPSIRADHPTQAATREGLEGLLRERKLDRTLTTTFPGQIGAEEVAPFGLGALDGRLLGGLPRGHVSELIGPVSSGRTSLAWTWLGTATSRGESVALIDTFDRFDPASGAACGIDLSRLLWVRGQAITKTSGAVDPAWLPGARAVEGPGTLLERTIDRVLSANRDSFPRPALRQSSDDHHVRPWHHRSAGVAAVLVGMHDPASRSHQRTRATR